MGCAPSTSSPVPCRLPGPPGDPRRLRFGWRGLLGIFIGVAPLQGLAALLEGFSHKDGRGWNIFGVVLLIGSVIVLVNPVASYGVVVWIAGIWLIIIGIFEIVAAFRVKSVAV